MDTISQKWSLSADSADAPPPFVWEGKTVVPVEFHRYALALTVDILQRRAIGHARISFSVAQGGYPLLEMVPSPSRIEVDGQPLPASKLPEVVPPNQETMVRVLDMEMSPGAPHELAIEYELTAASVSFANGGARLAFFMTDLDERGYLERHAPANFEFNQFPMSVSIKLIGAAKEHQIFTNGRLVAIPDGWTIDFPDDFCASSFYLHLTDRGFHVERDAIASHGRQIPLVAYGARGDEARQAIAVAKTVIGELEATYGPYTHDALTMYVTEDLNGGGMEYCGATMTGLRALPHEVLHSWFARGVMPANGNAGWIDEGIARWRDYGYPTRQPDPSREPANLAGFSPYRRHTPRTAYALGSLFFSELDHLFRQGGSGLRPVLSSLYRLKQRKQITTEFLKQFLERETGKDLSRMFERFVYGKPAGEFFSFEAMAAKQMATAMAIRELEKAATAHPPHRQFSAEELQALR